MFLSEKNGITFFAKRISHIKEKKGFTYTGKFVESSKKVIEYPNQFLRLAGGR